MEASDAQRASSTEGSGYAGKPEVKTYAVALRMDVQMRFGGIAGVADLAQQLTGADPIAGGHRDGAGPHVRDLHQLTARIDEHMVAVRGSYRAAPGTWSP